MAGINKKIMAFIGTEDASRIVTALAEYTDSIYAAVSEEYGKAPHPGGNITLISKYMDEERMNSWIERVGVDIVIDGTSVTAGASRAIIKKVCEDHGIEYLKIAARYETDLNTVICRKPEQLIRDMEYSVGNVLAEGDMDLYRILTAAKTYKENVIVMADADPEMIKELLDMGYPAENIMSINRLKNPEFLIALFKEFNISNYIFLGSEKTGTPERLEALSHCSVKASVYGDFVKDEGINVNDMWDMFVSRFGIED